VGVVPFRRRQSLREEDRVGSVRGVCSDGGRRMYRLDDQLPTLYSERFRTQLYNERVVHPGAWKKVVPPARTKTPRCSTTR
jgi:hypothetical protein